MKAKPIPLSQCFEWEDRFVSLIEFNESNGCCNWCGTKDSYGYGIFTIGGSIYKAHRIAFALRTGYCDTERTIDHLCRNTSCVNPDHMELVPSAENVRRGNGPFMQNKRKTNCKNGHPLEGDNVLQYPSEVKLGKRQCKICHNERSKRSAKKYRLSNKYQK